MAQDIAVFGDLVLPSGKAADWKSLDAAAASRRDWKDFAGPCAFKGTVADALALLKKGPPGAWSWALEVLSKRVAVRGILPRDAFHEHARMIAMLWLRAAAIGATGELAFRGFENSDAGWIVRLGAKPTVAPMTAAERRSADAAPAMKELRAAVAELVSEATPKGVKSEKAKAGGEAATRKGKPRERAAALVQLSATAPDDAARIALEWLTDGDVLDDESAYEQINAAAHVSGLTGARANLERLVAIVVEDEPEHAVVAAKEALGESRSPEAAVSLAAGLTDDNFREHVANTTELLRLLAARREVGDRAAVGRLARDAAKVVSTCDLPKASRADWAKKISDAAKALLAD